MIGVAGTAGVVSSVFASEVAGGGSDPGPKKGPGGGRAHEKHGRGSENSGAAQARQRAKQRSFISKLDQEQNALAQATKELNDLKEAKGSNFKLILGKLTEQQWIRQRQLAILGRK